MSGRAWSATGIQTHHRHCAVRTLLFVAGASPEHRVAAHLQLSVRAKRPHPVRCQRGSYSVSFEIESTYTGPGSDAGLHVYTYDNKDFTGPGHGFDLFPSGGSASMSVPAELIGQIPLWWADGIGSFRVYAWDGPITLNKLSFSIVGPSPVGYFKDVALTAVPEPSAFARWLMGSLSAGLVLRRRVTRS